MNKIESILSDLTILSDRIRVMHEELAPRGFTMASDTRLRLDRATVLIQRAEGLSDESAEASTWSEEASSLVTHLRAELG